MLTGRKDLHLIVADDNTILRQSFCALIEKSGIVKNIHEASNGSEVLAFLSKFRVDIVLMDVRMPVLDGLETAELIIRDYPEVRIVSITAFDEDATVLNLLRLGVHSILFKRNTNLSEIRVALTAVIEGKKYYNEKVSFTVQQNMNRMHCAPPAKFTPRDYEMVKFMSKGFAAKEIASQLSLSVNTIESYRKELLKKTGSKNTPELVSYAYKNGILG